MARTPADPALTRGPAAAERERRKAVEIMREQYAHDDAFEIDEDARVSVANNNGSIWVQIWARLDWEDFQ